MHQHVKGTNQTKICINVCLLSHNLVAVYPEKGPDNTRVFAFSCSLYTGFCKSNVTPVFVHTFFSETEMFLRVPSLLLGLGDSSDSAIIVVIRVTITYSFVTRGLLKKE